jgi:hypothetical protein
MMEYAAEHRVLEHIGEAAGMEGVTVIHAPLCHSREINAARHRACRNDCAA